MVLHSNGGGGSSAQGHGLGGPGGGGVLSDGGTTHGQGSVLPWGVGRVEALMGVIIRCGESSSSSSSSSQMQMQMQISNVHGMTGEGSDGYGDMAMSLVGLLAFPTCSSSSSSSSSLHHHHGQPINQDLIHLITGITLRSILAVSSRNHAGGGGLMAVLSRGRDFGDSFPTFSSSPSNQGGSMGGGGSGGNKYLSMVHVLAQDTSNRDGLGGGHGHGHLSGHSGAGAGMMAHNRPTLQVRPSSSMTNNMGFAGSTKGSGGSGSGGSGIPHTHTHTQPVSSMQWAIHEPPPPLSSLSHLINHSWFALSAIGFDTMSLPSCSMGARTNVWMITKVQLPPRPLTHPDTHTPSLRQPLPDIPSHTPPIYPLTIILSSSTPSHRHPPHPVIHP